MTRDDAQRLMLDIDHVEADLVRLQSRLYSVRRRLAEMTHMPLAGHDYEKEDADAKRSSTP